MEGLFEEAAPMPVHIGLLMGKDNSPVAASVDSAQRADQEALSSYPAFIKILKQRTKGVPGFLVSVVKHGRPCPTAELFHVSFANRMLVVCFQIQIDISVLHQLQQLLAKIERIGILRVAGGDVRSTGFRGNVPILIELGIEEPKLFIIAKLFQQCH